MEERENKKNALREIAFHLVERLLDAKIKIFVCTLYLSFSSPHNFKLTSIGIKSNMKSFVCTA